MRYLLCISTALAFLAACGGDDQETASPEATATAATPSAGIPEKLTGTWVRTFKQREVEAGGFEPGEYVMKLKPDGTLEVYFGPGKHDLNEECLGQEYCDALTATAQGAVL